MPKGKSARARRNKSTLMNKLDRVFSRYIRMRDADQDGQVTCVTCGKIAYWKDVDAGHYIKRQHMMTRWDARNCAAQCRKCNRFAGGAMDEFALHITTKYGAETLAELMRLKRIAKKWCEDDLQALIDSYESAARECEARMLPV